MGIIVSYLYNLNSEYLHSPLNLNDKPTSLHTTKNILNTTHYTIHTTPMTDKEKEIRMITKD